MWSPVLRKFPTLHVALSEGGIGWIPYFLERVDYVYRHHHAWTGHDFGDLLPSEMFNERFITCFIDDPFGVENRAHLNLDNVTWECDYPHSDSTWPTAPETVMRSLVGVPDDEIDRMTHRNAMRHFQYEPFRYRERAQCTVGTLRAEATDVDITPRSRARGASTNASWSASRSSASGTPPSAATPA